jgi:glycosyltransferase involved in cell wall biosynthesis
VQVVGKAHAALYHLHIDGEVLVADNGSTDGSQSLAQAAGARVIAVPVRGYGAALIGGIRAARGQYIIMGDADDSYDFSAIEPFVERLRAGDDLVMGSRLRGTILPGAMPPLHRWLGNPILTAIGNLLFRTRISDYHCGLRGFSTARARALDLRTTGMEFATELVAKMALHGARISEIPIIYYPDGRSRRPHLRTWRDGWRHLKFMLMLSPVWVFIAPGLPLLCLALAGLAFSLLMPGVSDGLSARLAAQIGFSVLMLLAVQMIIFGVLARLYAGKMKLLPVPPFWRWLEDALSVDHGLLGGGLLAAGSIVLLVWAISASAFGGLLLGLLLLALAAQGVFMSFVVSLIRIKDSFEHGEAAHEPDQTDL